LPQGSQRQMTQSGVLDHVLSLVVHAGQAVIRALESQAASADLEDGGLGPAAGVRR
jgi:hypothetical protein